jgi:serine/threonine protein kinase
MLPNPVIHRDIKPENLILASDGRVVLVDFGLMKEVERRIEAAESYVNTFGTLEYAPPEQFDEHGWGTDARSDIYSLGATIYYLLAGRLPPRAKDRVVAGHWEKLWAADRNAHGERLGTVRGPLDVSEGKPIFSLHIYV